MFLGWGNAGCCAVMLYLGEGPRGSNGACSTLHWISATPLATHNQIGPLWCWFPSGWACARSRPLWVSPPTSPVRLGVSPAASPTPTGVFNQRFEALFPQLEPWVMQSASLPAVCSGLSVHECGAGGATCRSVCPILRHSESGPLGLSVRECGAAGSAGGRTACPFVPHSASLGPAMATRVLSALVPISTPPTGLDECLFFISLVSDFLAV